MTVSQPVMTVTRLIDGGDGADTIDSGIDDDSVDGGNGNDSIVSGQGNDDVNGGAGDDVINSTGPEASGLPDINPDGTVNDPRPNDDLDTVDGGAGDDSIFTGDDADIVNGGAGDDTIDGGIDNDTLDGGAVNPAQAGNGPITIDGGESDDGDAVRDTDLDADDADFDVLDLRGVTGQNGQQIILDDITFVDGTQDEDGSVTLEDGTVLTFSNFEARLRSRICPKATW